MLRVQVLDILRVGVRSSRTQNLDLYWDQMVYLMDNRMMVFYMETKILKYRNWEV